MHQNRTTECRQVLENHLQDNPDDVIGQIYYVSVLTNMGEQELAREIIEPILHENPDHPTILELAATIELNDDKIPAAERIARMLLEANPRDEDAFVLMARIKLAQNNYDAVLHNVDEALAIEPEHTEALNLKIMVSSLLGKEDVGITVEEALAASPDNPGTIAQHAYSLLSAGKGKEALERAKYALSLNPENQMARYVMLEGLKSQNPLYRLYFKYNQFMARMSGGASFAVVLGLWFGVNYLNRFAGTNPEYAPFIKPVVYLAIGLFLLTWIITPLMDFYLLTNRYGKLLLDRKEKIMAKLVGAALGLAVIGFLGYAVLDTERGFLAALVGIGLMIPFGSFLRPIKKKQQQILGALAGVIAFLGLTAIFTANSSFFTIGVISLLGYQFLVNGMIAREAGRTFGE